MEMKKFNKLLLKSYIFLIYLDVSKFPLCATQCAEGKFPLKIVCMYVFIFIQSISISYNVFYINQVYNKN